MAWRVLSRRALRASSNTFTQLSSSGISNIPHRRNLWPGPTRLSQTEVGAASTNGTATGNDQRKNMGSRLQANADQAAAITMPGNCVKKASRHEVSWVRFCPAQVSDTFNNAPRTYRL